MLFRSPYITIDGVQISVEDLPEEAQGVFGRIQRLNQKKVRSEERRVGKECRSRRSPDQ